MNAVVARIAMLGAGYLAGPLITEKVSFVSNFVQGDRNRTKQAMVNVSAGALGFLLAYSLTTYK